MCEPTTIMMIGMGISAVAGLVEARAQRQAGKANQQISENNAKMAEQAGKDVQVLATRDQQQSAWRTRALIGQQKVAAAASGIDLDIGTPLDIMGETAMFGKADEDAIGLDAARKAWGFSGEATNSRNQGAQARWSGNQQSKATILKTIGSGLSSYSSLQAMKPAASRPTLSTVATPTNASAAWMRY